MVLICSGYSKSYTLNPYMTPILLPKLETLILSNRLSLLVVTPQPGLHGLANTTMQGAKSDVKAMRKFFTDAVCQLSIVATQERNAKAFGCADLGPLAT